MWRQNRWRANVDYIRLPEFRKENPDLAEKLESGHAVVTDAFYAYRIPKSRGVRIVEKVYIEEYRAGGMSAFHMPREHKNHTMDPNQKTL